MLKLAVFCILVVAATSCKVPEFRVTFKRGTTTKYGLYTKNFVENAERIYGRNENIGVLCEGTFSDLKNVKEISVLASDISGVEVGAFKNLPKLTKIDLKNNSISEIKDGVFDHLPELYYINLDHNSIEKIGSNAFSNVKDLTIIILSDNKLNYLDTHWFAKNSELTLMDLSYNNLHTVPSGFLKFEKQHKDALTIDFYTNPIEVIEEQAFENIDLIDKFNIARSNLKQLTPMFKNVGEVQHLEYDYFRSNCFAQPALDNWKVVKRITVSEDEVDDDCYEQLTTWGKKNNVKVTKR